MKSSRADKPPLKSTTVGAINSEVLAFTAGKDVELDRSLVEADCLGTAAHVTMLSRLPVRPPILTAEQAAQVRRELARIIKAARDGAFQITLEDQDVHLAVERERPADWAIWANGSTRREAAMTKWRLTCEFMGETSSCSCLNPAANWPGLCFASAGAMSIGRW